MLFQHTFNWVLASSPHTNQPKTLTSRPIQYGDYIQQRTPEGEILVVKDQHGRVKYAVGNTYAIQPGRGKPAVGRFKLTRIYRAERTGVISPAEAEAEGFATPEAFRTIWNQIYGDQALNRPCWRLQLEVIR